MTFKNQRLYHLVSTTTTTTSRLLNCSYIQFQFRDSLKSETLWNGKAMLGNSVKWKTHFRDSSEMKNSTSILHGDMKNPLKGKVHFRGCIWESVTGFSYSCLIYILSLPNCIPCSEGKKWSAHVLQDVVYISIVDIAALPSHSGSFHDTKAWEESYCERRDPSSW